VVECEDVEDQYDADPNEPFHDGFSLGLIAASDRSLDPAVRRIWPAVRAVPDRQNVDQDERAEGDEELHFGLFLVPAMWLFAGC
jgi:hypothetical protein